MTADLAITAKGRRAGKTTMLLDIALANARRGQVVWFLSANGPMAQNAMARAADLIGQSSESYVQIDSCPTLPTISYPGGGVVLFLSPGEATVTARGRARPDLRINDWSGLTATIDRSAP